MKSYAKMLTCCMASRRSKSASFFTLLISVSGVGGQTAKVILSSFSPGELANIIQMENVKLLRGVKGIGPKAAQRIVLDLKDKVVGIEGGTTVQQGAANAVNANAVAEAVSALTTLGFPPAASQKCVAALLQENPNLPIEQVIKTGFKTTLICTSLLK